VFISIILREILLGIEYLHSTGKIHRDIKPANILLTDKGEVKIADFGVSAELSKTDTNRESFVGTPYWMAPEMLCSKKYNQKVDIWALGITGINLATGRVPYQDIKPF
jgi:serine/threonine protein kinase